MKTTLYKLNNTGKVSWWELTQNGSQYIIRWGQDHRNRSPTDNTNAYQEKDTATAIAKCHSLIKQQTDRRGYQTTIPKSPPHQPMLAQKYDPKKPPEWKQLAIQPKLDGIRCLASNRGLTTRTNEPLTSVPHIEEICKSLPPGIELDGELYIHGTDLQLIQSYVLRKRPHKLSKLIEYHVYDIVDTESHFIKRSTQLNQLIGILHQQFSQEKEDLAHHATLLKQYQVDEFPIKLVLTQLIKNGEGMQDTLTSAFKATTAQGYEGLMLRNPQDDGYQLNYRSPDLLKYKERQDTEFEIIDISEGYDQTGIYVCKTEDGKVFEATPKATRDKKRYILRNKEKYVGKMLTVEFETYSKDGIPLKPVGKVIRKD